MYTAYITDTITNETRTEDFVEDWFDGFDYLWSEGNFGCDCNRGIFFGAEDFECGEGRYKVIIKMGDEVVYDDESL